MGPYSGKLLRFSVFEFRAEAGRIETHHGGVGSAFGPRAHKGARQRKGLGSREFRGLGIRGLGFRVTGLDSSVKTEERKHTRQGETRIGRCRRAKTRKTTK